MFIDGYLNKDSLSPVTKSKKNVIQVAETVTTSNAAGIALLVRLSSELLNRKTSHVSCCVKSYAVMLLVSRYTSQITSTTLLQQSPMKNFISLIRLDVWELVEDHFAENVINLCGSGKTNVIEENISFRTKFSSVAMGYAQKEELISKKEYCTCCSVGGLYGLFIAYAAHNHLQYQYGSFKQILVGPLKRKQQDMNQILCMAHVIVSLSAKPTEKHLTAVKGSFGTLKTPLTWVSGRSDSILSLSACCAQVSLWMRTSSQIMAFTLLKYLCIVTLRQPSHSRAILFPAFRTSTIDLADCSLKALSEIVKSLVRQLGMRCLTPDELEVLAIESA
ncbi:hypothetical protein Tco_0282777 [Tanacetum coccineum]